MKEVFDSSARYASCSRREARWDREATPRAVDERIGEGSRVMTSQKTALAIGTAEVPPVSLTLQVNGAERSAQIDARVTLLDLLREAWLLTGTKKGCDQGTCGACTVIVDGQRVLSCLMLAAACEGQQVVTIEGLARGDELHPMQASFLEHDGFQCGFCTPGQIVSAVCALREVQAGVPSHVTRDVRQAVDVATLTNEEIRKRMSGNLCRCGAYPNIVAAVRQALLNEVRCRPLASILSERSSLGSATTPCLR
jgi:xanthine dehydrogenase YagT iron-sulfur-binding subunit